MNEEYPEEMPPMEQTQKPWGMEVNTYCMLLHLSQLTILCTGVGIALPIVMWAVNKDQFPEVDAHGRIVVNWLLSTLIYAIVSGLLVFVFVGFFLLMILGVLTVVFPIIGGLKANDGQVWKYPLTIKFF